MYKDKFTGKQLVVFKLEAHLFGIDITRLSEMIEIENLRTGDNAFSHSAGTIEVRGKTVPVVDLRKRFNLAKALGNQDNRILVIDYEGRELGIKVDSVTGLVKVQKSGISPIDYLFIGEHLEHLDGVVKYKDKPILLMDIETILTEVDQSIIKQMENDKTLCR